MSICVATAPPLEHHTAARDSSRWTTFTWIFTGLILPLMWVSVAVCNTARFYKYSQHDCLPTELYENVEHRMPCAPFYTGRFVVCGL